MGRTGHPRSWLQPSARGIPAWALAPHIRHSALALNWAETGALLLFLIALCFSSTGFSGEDKCRILDCTIEVQLWKTEFENGLAVGEAPVKTILYRSKTAPVQTKEFTDHPNSPIGVTYIAKLEIPEGGIVFDATSANSNVTMNVINQDGNTVSGGFYQGDDPISQLVGYRGQLFTEREQRHHGFRTLKTDLSGAKLGL